VLPDVTFRDAIGTVAMGHIFLMGLGSWGDLNPLLGIGVALRERGHHTTLVSAPQFASAASSIGADFFGIGTSEAYEGIYADPDLWHPRRGLGVFFPYAAGLSDQIASIVEEHHVPGDTVMVSTFQCFGARVAQEALGLPLCTVLPNPILLQSAWDPGQSPIGNPPAWLGKGALRLMYWVSNREISRHARRGVNEALRRRGLAPIRDIVGWSRSPDRVLGLWPSALAAPQRDWPPQAKTTGFISFDGPTAVGWSPPGDLQDRSDWLVFTPGTQMTHGAEFFSMACDVAEDIGIPALMVAKDRSALPEGLPDNVQHLGFAPFAWLFERASLVVHHGGIGTSGRALEAGCPQLIVPSGFDQFDNAERIVRLGVGEQIRREHLTRSSLSAALRRLRGSDPVRKRCREIRSELAQSGAVGETCDEIERLLKRDNG
jgi:UDP:flavonoid glycosyltransferase YjiC (YdhE family)